jgi:PIN domain nuclease of toxin-antitoxin system
VRLLVDTHCWLWQLAEPERLKEPVRSLLADRGNEVFLSVASIWEIVIKAQLGKLALPEPAEVFVPRRMEALGNFALPITEPHVLRIATLPLHHRDPFDRILLSQALVEGLPLVTADARLKDYELELLWAGL